MLRLLGVGAHLGRDEELVAHLGQDLAGLAYSVVTWRQVCLELATGLLWVHGLADRSGVWGPWLDWDVAQNVSVAVHAFLPYGPGSSGGRLGSEYGATPAGILFLQISLYF